MSYNEQFKTNTTTNRDWWYEHSLDFKYDYDCCSLQVFHSILCNLIIFD